MATRDRWRSACVRSLLDAKASMLTQAETRGSKEGRGGMERRGKGKQVGMVLWGLDAGAGSPSPTTLGSRTGGA
jgi:hypothetical protein